MSSLNRVQLIGNLGKDPEVRYSAGGMAVCTFSIATTERWKDKDTNEVKEETEWHRITMFGRVAEVAGEYLKKGRKCYVEGRIRTEQWEDNDGNERRTTKVIADKLVLLDSADRGEGGQRRERGEPRGRQQEPQHQPQGAPAQQGFDDDDIPF